MKKLWTKHRRKSMKICWLVQKFGRNTPDQRVSFVGWWVGGWYTFFRPHSGIAELSIYPSYARSSLAPLGKTLNRFFKTPVWKEKCKTSVFKKEVCKTSVFKKEMCKTTVFKKEMCKTSVFKKEVCITSVFGKEMCKTSVFKQEMCKTSDKVR